MCGKTRVLRCVAAALGVMFAVGCGGCRGAGLGGRSDEAATTQPSGPSPRGEDLFSIGAGYIDRSGKVVIKRRFLAHHEFSEGFAKVQVGRPFTFINTRGELLTKPQFGLAGDFHEGLAQVAHWPKLFRMTRRWGYIDTQGRLVIDHEFQQANEFSEGLAAVQRSYGDKWGYINRQGQYVIEPEFDMWPRSFSHGLAAVGLNGKWGYIDKRGRYVVEPQYVKALSFSEGLAAVAKDDRWGYIDTQGRMVIRLDFEDRPRATKAESFSEGLAAVRIGRLWGYIDKHAKLVIKPRFTRAMPFSQERAAVLIGGTWSEKWQRWRTGSWQKPERGWVGGVWGFIDPTGKWVIEPRFVGFYAGPFRNGLAGVTTGLLDGRHIGMYIDRQGQAVWPRDKR